MLKQPYCTAIDARSCGFTTIEMAESKPCMLSVSPSVALVLIAKKAASFLRNHGKHSKDLRHFLAVMLVRKGTNEQRRKLFFFITRTASLPGGPTTLSSMKSHFSLNEINRSVEHAAHSGPTF